MSHVVVLYIHAVVELCMKQQMVVITLAGGGKTHLNHQNIPDGFILISATFWDRLVDSPHQILKLF